MTEYEKLEAVRKYAAMNKTTFAKTLGVKTLQTFRDVKNGRNGISAALAMSILTAFPEISRNWLLFSEGEMLTSANANALTLQDGAGSQSDITFSSLFPNAHSAVRVVDDAMAQYPIGSIAILRTAQADTLVYGNDYYVKTDQLAVIRKVQRGADAHTLRLYASNNKAYPDGRAQYEVIDVAVADITELYSVAGYIVCQAADVKGIRE